MRLGWIFAIFLSHSLNAWEIDNVTCRFRTLRDSRSAINQEVNNRIAAVLNGPAPSSGSPISATIEATPTSGGCSREILERLRPAIAAPWDSNMETFVEDSPTLDKCKPEPHVYSEISRWDKGVVSLAGIGSSIRMGQHMIGADKLSHFMSEGFEYFKKWETLTSDKNQTPNQIPTNIYMQLHQQGIDEETGRFGLATTGIYSHADTMANFQGFFFWKDVIDGPNPYLKCESGKWVQKRQFDWMKYINPAWDEGMNCNRYNNARMQSAVDSYTQRMAAQYNHTRANKCPLDPAACASVVQTYQPRAMLESILHPACYRAGGGSGGSRSESVPGPPPGPGVGPGLSDGIPEVVQ